MATYPVKLLIDKNGTAFIPVVNSDSIITPDGDTLDDLLDEKQDTLVSGTNLKTINNQSLLGSGNIDVSGGGGTPTDVRINGTSITSNNVADIITEGTYNASTNKIATMNEVAPRLKQVTIGTDEYTTTIINSGSSLMLASAVSDTSTQTGSLAGLAITDSQISLFDGSGSANSTAILSGVRTPTNDNDAANKSYVDTQVATKQDTLVSGTNIKTINSTSLLGSGDMALQEEIKIYLKSSILSGSVVADVVDDISNEKPFLINLGGTNPTKAITTKIGYGSGEYWFYYIGTDGDQHKITITNSGKTYSIVETEEEYQEKLVSGTNIKTINNTSILGSGNISISGGSATDVQVNGTSITSSGVANLLTNSAYNSSSNKIATMSDITNKIKTTTSTTSGDVYDVTYINTMLGDIESLLGGI